MPSFNRVVLMGHLAGDPELRYTNWGAAVCSLTVAVNRKFTKKSGEKAEEVAFVEVIAWNRLAEISAEYLKQGRPIHLEGHLIQERWVDEQTGQKRSKLKVVADAIQFLGGGSKDQLPAGERPAGEEAPPAAPALGKSPK